MNNNGIQSNPFKVFTPEHMDADQASSLFVEPFTEVQKLYDPGHAMLNGPRGSGKSMIFRYLLADCQCVARSLPLKRLEFLAFLVSIKNTGPAASLMEFAKAQAGNPNAGFVLNEHVLTIYVASKVYKTLAVLNIADRTDWSHAATRYFATIKRLLATCGYDKHDSKLPKSPSVSTVFEHITDIFDGLYQTVVQYSKRLTIDPAHPYTGPLCGYTDFLIPAMQALQNLPFLPNSPIYLLVDDADYLNIHQTKVLNSWISTRTSDTISIKVSTQFHYKSFSTISGFRIQSPHDYQEIDIAHLYTTRSSQYMQRVRKIVIRRLDWWSRNNSPAIQQSPEQFFPVNEIQEAKIRDIEQQLRADFGESGRGYRASDDVIRYARPNYIRSLLGSGKSGSTYSYAGFSQLVHISSGLVRYFLEAAAIMFDNQIIEEGIERCTFIKPSIQDSVIRMEADKLLGSESGAFAIDIPREWGEQATASQPDRGENTLETKRLRNLIRALGGIFYTRLISEYAERRVFSVAISGVADSDVKDVLDLGVQLGFFHRTMIGNKDGTGRTPLYVLTRRLAPFFKLDPSSFAGYLWITSQKLRDAITDPDRIVRWARDEGSRLDIDQLSLF